MSRRDVDPGASGGDSGSGTTRSLDSADHEIDGAVGNTVRKYLRGGGKAAYGPREPRACKVDLYNIHVTRPESAQGHQGSSPDPSSCLH